MPFPVVLPSLAVKIVKAALEIMWLTKKRNPLQIVADAVAKVQ
jgi:ribosomal protein S7